MDLPSNQPPQVIENIKLAQYKYLGFLTVPAVGALAILGEGFWTFSAVIYAFVIIPLVELVIPADKNNLSESQAKNFKSKKFFKFIMGLVVPIYLGLVLMFLYRMSYTPVSTMEWFGIVSAFGIMCGVIAINVGHELGHRHDKLERLMGEILLVVSLQSHFLPYHNHGHHRNAATPDDPATARLNEPLYLFWIRSQIGSYVAAWKIEHFRLTHRKQSPWSFKNRMVRYTALEGLLLLGIYLLLGLKVLLAFIAACFVGMLLLETVNYIEHYGLLRKKDDNGKFERVTPKHSWNSDHQIGRIVLFELSRHSDHHAYPGKPYQCLASYKNSPQMPTGYPGMMLLSAIPPLWFRVMNPKIQSIQ